MQFNGRKQRMIHSSGQKEGEKERVSESATRYVYIKFIHSSAFPRRIRTKENKAEGDEDEHEMEEDNCNETLFSNIINLHSHDSLYHIINASHRINLQAHKFNTDPFV